MTEFDPSRPSKIHDVLNDQLYPYDPAARFDWDQYAVYQPDGLVAWDGMILDGWCEAEA